MVKILLISVGLLCALGVDAKRTLSDSVNQAQKQGKVLSAKTRNGEHVVKVLTPEGRIKTLRQPADQHHNKQQKYPFPKNQRQRSDDRKKPFNKPSNRHRNDSNRQPRSRNSFKQGGRNTMKTDRNRVNRNQSKDRDK